MRVLSIDTTSMLGSIALSDDRRLVAQWQQGVRRTHSEGLMSSIDHLLSLARWQKTEIEAIAVATGPGSFTGLRIGLAAAKGMALALGVPVAGVSSLAALAEGGREFSGTVVPLIDARRGELYASAWQFPRGAKAQMRMKECVLPPEALIAGLERIRGELLLVGDGAIAYGAKICEALGPRAIIPQGSRCFPQAMNLALLALSRLKDGEGDDIAALVPNYVRLSDAEIGFEGRRSHKKRAGSWN